MNLFENLQALKESSFDKDLIINMVKDGFETGHPYVDYEEFSQDTEIGDVDAAWEFYNELINLGPAGFYEEYADKLEFSDDYKAEYGSEEPHVDDELDDESHNVSVENKLSSQYIRGPVYPKPEGGPKVYWTYKIDALDKSEDEAKVFTTYIFCMDEKHAIDYMSKTYPNASIQEIESVGSYTAEQTGAPIINLTDKKSVNESAILKDDKDIEQVEEASILEDEKDMEVVVEQADDISEDEDYGTIGYCPECNAKLDVDECERSKEWDEYGNIIYVTCPECGCVEREEKYLSEAKIVKDEKDIEQVVEGVEPVTEDFEGSKEMFTKKAKKFAEMVDALAAVISEDELHEFLKNLSQDLDMDVYTAGDVYPYEPDGYFSVGSLDDLDLSNENDGAEFDWVYEELTNCITKINAKITSVIDELKGKIASLELVL